MTLSAVPILYYFSIFTSVGENVLLSLHNSVYFRSINSHWFHKIIEKWHIMIK